MQCIVLYISIVDRVFHFPETIVAKKSKNFGLMRLQEIEKVVAKRTNQNSERKIKVCQSLYMRNWRKWNICYPILQKTYLVNISTTGTSATN